MVLTIMLTHLSQKYKLIDTSAPIFLFANIGICFEKTNFADLRPVAYNDAVISQILTCLIQNTNTKKALLFPFRRIHLCYI